MVGCTFGQGGQKVSVFDPFFSSFDMVISFHYLLSGLLKVVSSSMMLIFTKSLYSACDRSKAVQPHQIGVLLLNPETAEPALQISISSYW